ncbi:glucose dehydrogenase [Haloferula helveola]|uniref:Glucose dehydrogenase n=1 Tax=Haloferula helveola TaxID=490095 RepID=A0ABM7RJZ6_9BACT|nr:glucose dehydrogenase [Haloferula helveola]
MKFIQTLAIATALAPFAPAAPVTKPCADGLVRTQIASQPALKNPVSVSVDADGTVYVTETSRRKVADLDIREVGFFREDDLGLESIDDKLALFREKITSERFKKHGSLKDHNRDGRIDSKDLTAFSERIHRLTDKDGDGVYETSNVFADGFDTEVTGIAAGVLAWNGDVYATVAPDVWKLRDTDGDGKADQRESIAHGFGLHINYAGHDMHGLTPGPDGRLYWTIGDKALNVVSKEGTRFFYPEQGALLRCYPDGSGFEVFAHGLRNVQEIAFDDYGNLFGVDNDSDQKGEKERLVFIPEGSDTGWRVNYQYRGKDYNPWMAERISFPDGDNRPATWLPALQNYVDGPAGFAFNPGTALSPKYRNRFFLTQFPKGRIMAMELVPEGAGFRLASDSVLAEGDAFVGCSFGPDGALYVVDWAGGYPLNDKGAVWRIDDPKEAGSPIRKEVAGYLAAGPGKVAAPELLKRLGHADQRVRLDAQWELARRKEADVLTQAARSGQTLSVVHGLWGLSQLGKFDADVFGELAKSEVPEVRAQAAKWVAETATKDAVLAPLLADSSARVRFHACMAVAKTGRRDLLPQVIELIAANADSDANLRHSATMALAMAGTPADLTLHQHPSPAVRRAAAIALHRAIDTHFRVRPATVSSEERMRDPEVLEREAVLAGYLGDKDPSIATEASIAPYDTPATPTGLESVSLLIESRPDLPEAAIRRSIGANRHLGTPQALRRLAIFGALNSAPESLRSHALDVLSSADSALTLDPVDGRRVDLPASDLPSNLRVALGVILAGIDGGKDLKKSASEAIARVGEKLTPDQLAKRAADPKVDAGTRLLAFASLTGDDLRKQTAIVMMKSNDPTVRSGAASGIAGEQPEIVLSYIRNVALPSEELAETQNAIRLLGKLKSPKARPLIEALVASAIDGSANTGLLLEIIEAAKASNVESTALEANLAKTSAHLLHGGDADRGAEIFNTSLAANCTACHRIGPDGSEVGPPLDKAGTKEREYLLESLLNPQAAIAEGYPTPSSMPPMGLILPPADIRDLVEFLASQK